MPKVPYLFIQLKDPGTYEILLPSWTHDIPDGHNVKALLDHATSELCDVLRVHSPKGFVLRAFTLIDPISNFHGLPTADVAAQLGDLDDVFFNNKAIFWHPDNPLSSLGARDGKVIVLIKTSAKRALTPTDEPIFDRLKRTKFAIVAPSTMALPSKYENIQLIPSQKILDDRPKPDADISPISLLYHGFGQFLDIFDGSTNGLSDVNMAELQRQVDYFAQSMCLFYDNEDRRRDAAQPILNHIFSARTGVEIPALCIGSARSDGHNVGKHGGAAMVANFKNWSAHNITIPEVELVGYVAHLHEGMKDNRNLFESWRIPCIGLTVVGALIRFYAIVLVDDQYRVVSLTPGLSCVPSASEGRDRKALYKAFAAASVLQASILEDAERFLITPPPKIPANARRFPDITRLRRWGSTSEYLTFQILGFFS